MPPTKWRVDPPPQMGFAVCVQSYRKDSPSSGLFRVRVYNACACAQAQASTAWPSATARACSRGRSCQCRQAELAKRIPPAASGGGGPAQRHAAPRELYRAGLLSSRSLRGGLLSVDADAGGVQDWQSSEDCQSFGAFPHRPRADAHGPSWQQHPGQAARSTTPRWAASSPVPASGTGANSPPSTGPCSCRASP
jgi:hypothetical protein